MTHFRKHSLLLEALVDLLEIGGDDHYKCDLDVEDCWLDEADKHVVMRKARQAIATAIEGKFTCGQCGRKA